MIVYDKGLPSLPDDIIHDIFSLLDAKALKSCSLTGKALSYSAKPFLENCTSLPGLGVPQSPALPVAGTNSGDYRPSANAVSSNTLVTSQ